MTTGKILSESFTQQDRDNHHLSELLSAKASELLVLAANAAVLFFDDSLLDAIKAVASLVLLIAPRPVSRRSTPRLDNPVPGCLINAIARFFITRLAFLSALSSLPQDRQTNFS